MKYSTLKQQIEDLDGDSSLKEWDDLARKIYKAKNIGSGYLALNICPDLCSSIYIVKWDSYKDWKEVIGFDYKTQYEKMEAFKKALLWLLDHSDIPKVDKKKETIEQLQIDLAKIKKRIEELEA